MNEWTNELNHWNEGSNRKWNISKTNSNKYLRLLMQCWQMRFLSKKKVLSSHLWVSIALTLIYVSEGTVLKVYNFIWLLWFAKFAYLFFWWFHIFHLRSDQKWTVLMHSEWHTRVCFLFIIVFPICNITQYKYQT